MKKIPPTLGILFLIGTACAQNVGIGITNPKAKLHVADSAVLFSGPTSLPANPGFVPITGIGTRMMWLPAKGAFRAGGVSGTQWNDAFIGNYSTALGFSNRAAGQYATSVGWGNSSSGDGTFTTGFSNTASGKYSAALGTNTDAQAYGSLALGRYNILAGDASNWVDGDPLFVIGNGYLRETSPGIAEVVRRNALTINKSGIATFHNEIRTDNDLRVAGFGVFGRTLNLQEGLIADGPGIFRHNLYANGKLNVDTIENLKVMNAEYANGATPEVNLVPLGVVEFKASYSTTLLNNTPNTTYKNLAANLVTSVVGLYDQGRLEEDAIVGIRLIFNTSKIGDYREVIAVGHSRFDGVGFTGNANISEAGTKINKDAATGKPISCEISFLASELPEIGGFASYGTYMFYGLK